MNPSIIVVLAGLIALASVLGLSWRARNGRIRRFAQGSKDRIFIDDVAELGDQATLLQFSTDVCAPCRATHALLAGLATELGEPAAIKYIEINVTSRPEIVNRYNLLQSPTTFILDAEGTLRARIGGTPKREAVEAELQRILIPT